MEFDPTGLDVLAQQMAAYLFAALVAGAVVGWITSAPRK